ncbi:MAG: DMT family transporter [Burkholderiales bacterium]|nr:DMT family transporter [Burkholderiales bacterium]
MIHQRSNPYNVKVIDTAELLRDQTARNDGMPKIVDQYKLKVEMNPYKNRLIGMAYIALSATAFGVMPFFANMAYRSGVTPTSLLFLRFGIAAVLMWVFLLYKHSPLPRGKTLLGLVLMGGLGYAGQSFSYFTALQFAPAGLVAVLLYLYPTLVTGLSFAVLKQPITRIKLGALILSLLGILLVIDVQSGGQMTGVLLAILAAVIYAVYIMAGAKVTQGTDIRVSSTVIITSAAVVYGVYGAWHGLSLPNSEMGWVGSIGLALIGTVVAVWAFFEGVKRIGAVDASMLSTLEPVVTVVLAWVLLGERLTALNLCGGVLILVAAVLLARAR